MKDHAGSASVAATGGWVMAGRLGAAIAAMQRCNQDRPEHSRNTAPEGGIGARSWHLRSSVPSPFFQRGLIWKSRRHRTRIPPRHRRRRVATRPKAGLLRSNGSGARSPAGWRAARPPGAFLRMQSPPAVADEIDRPSTCYGPRQMRMRSPSRSLPRGRPPAPRGRPCRCTRRAHAGRKRASVTRATSWPTRGVYRADVS